jgi:apolipoprotein N-acyltransferase
MKSHRAQSLHYFWAAVSGALLVVSFPNYSLWPVAFIFLVPLLLCAEGKSGRDAFFLGAFAGVFAYIGLIYWVIVAVHRYGNIPLPLAIPILFLLAIYLSLYWGGFTFLISFINAKSEWGMLLVTPVLWVGLEYVRSFLLSGFPWVLVGYTQYSNTLFIQLADITGVYGVSFLIILINTLLYLWLAPKKDGRKRAKKYKALWIPSLCTLALVALTCTYGYWRVHYSFKTEKGIIVGVAQGNIPQDIKWDAAFKKRTMTIYDKLSLRLAEQSPGLIVWPETAFPDYFPSGTELDAEVMTIPQETGAYLLFGSLSEKGKGKRRAVYNSAYLISPQRQIIGQYDKIHLVPFGEYVPLSTHFPAFNALAGVGNIAAGKETVIFRLPRGRFGVLVCFEVIFPELCRANVRTGADFMLTITNDAWFGRTSAPLQHLTQVSFRAIENRVWFVRAANTGISAFIDPWGRIKKSSDLFTSEILADEIGFKTRALTFYTKHGDLFALACLSLALAFVIFLVIKRLIVWS